MTGRDGPRAPETGTNQNKKGPLGDSSRLLNGVKSQRLTTFEASSHFLIPSFRSKD